MDNGLLASIINIILTTRRFLPSFRGYCNEILTFLCVGASRPNLFDAFKKQLFQDEAKAEICFL
jgi:hypothetical protein